MGREWIQRQEHGNLVAKRRDSGVLVWSAKATFEARERDAVAEEKGQG
jgi:hypothetical protein